MPHSTSWRSILKLSIYTWVFQVAAFPQFFLLKPCIHLSSPLLIRATCPALLILLAFITRIIFSEEDRSLNSPLCSFLHSTFTSSLLDPNILPSTLFSNTLSLRSSLNVSYQVSHPYKTTDKIIFLYILIFIFLDSKLEDKTYCTKWLETFPEFNVLLNFSRIEFWFGFFPNIWTIPPFQRNYYHSLYCDFFLHSDLETWPCA
jgi:hypothetical protein